MVAYKSKTLPVDPEALGRRSILNGQIESTFFLLE
jgi:hypothetical protein